MYTSVIVQGRNLNFFPTFHNVCYCLSADRNVESYKKQVPL
jgi:hypothetical protein